MTRRRAFVLSLLLLGGASACANILGDFTSGEGAADGGGDGAQSNDAAAADGMSNADGPNSMLDGGGDGEAAAPPPVLSCTVQSQPQLLGTIVRQNGNQPDTIFFLGPTATSQTAYVVVQGDGTGTNAQSADVFRYIPGQTGGGNIINDPSPSGQIFDAQRTADGIVILALDQNLPGNPGHSQLVVYKLSENVTDSGVPVWQTIPIGPIDPVPGNTCREVGSFLVVDSTKNDYIVAFSYNPAPAGCNGTIDPPLLFVARTGTAPDGGASARLVYWDIPQLDGGTIAVGLARDSIVLDPGSSKVYVFVDPSGGGPVPGVGPFVFSSAATLPEGGATVQGMNLGSGGASFASGLGYAGSPSAGGINVGLLGGDLSLTVPGFYVGNAPSSTVATLPISSTYKETVVNGIDALPVDKGRSHWHTFNGGNENLLLIGRNDLGANSQGVNIYWIDRAGNARVKQAGSDAGAAGALLQDHLVVGADITFNGPPTGVPAVIGDLYIAVTEQTDAGGINAYYSVTQYHTSCLP